MASRNLLRLIGPCSDCTLNTGFSFVPLRYRSSRPRKLSKFSRLVAATARYSLTAFLSLLTPAGANVLFNLTQTLCRCLIRPTAEGRWTLLSPIASERRGSEMGMLRPAGGLTARALPRRSKAAVRSPVPIGNADYTFAVPAKLSPLPEVFRVASPSPRGPPFSRSIRCRRSLPLRAWGQCLIFPFCLLAPAPSLPICH